METFLGNLSRISGSCFLFCKGDLCQIGLSIQYRFDHGTHTQNVICNSVFRLDRLPFRKYEQELRKSHKKRLGLNFGSQLFRLLPGEPIRLYRFGIYLGGFGKNYLIRISYDRPHYRFYSFQKEIKRAEIFAILLTYSGIVVAFIGDIQAEEPNTTKGVLFILGSAIAYALYLVGSESLIPKLGSVRFTSYLMLLSGSIVIIHFLITHHPASLIQPTNVYLYGLALGVLTTVIPAYFTTEGIRMIGSGKAAIVGSVGPMSTILLAWIFLGEPITFSGLVGTILVLTGVLWIGRKKTEPKTEGDS